MILDLEVQEKNCRKFIRRFDLDRDIVSLSGKMGLFPK